MSEKKPDRIHKLELVQQADGQMRLSLEAQLPTEVALAIVAAIHESKQPKQDK